MNVFQDTKSTISVRNMLYVVEGDPIPLQRPRFSGHVWDSQKQAKLLVGITLRNSHASHPLFEGILHVSLEFYMRPPVKKFDKMIGLYHCYKPDIDNLIKFYLDCASTVLFTDDCRIASLQAVKKYDAIPRTVIMIQKINKGH